MSNYRKLVSRGVPAYAEALGVRSSEEMRYIIMENGQLVFRPPSPEILHRLMSEAARKKEAEQQLSGGHSVEKKQAEKSVEMPKLKKPDSIPKVEPVQAASGHGTGRANSRPGTKKSSGIKVDLDAFPIWAHNLSVRRHRPGGQFYWNPSKVTLFKSAHQSGKGIAGTALKIALHAKQLLNANLLHWLLKNQHQIPTAWRRNGRKIFFWDTIFEDHQNRACILFLTMRSQRWMMGKQRLTEIWTSNDYAVCRS